MGRVKQNMELIQKENKRRLIFQKRKISLIKKANELSILCDVQLGLIVYGPKEDGIGMPNEPEIWPSDIRDIINKYKNQPFEERRNRSIGVLEFLAERKKKTEQALEKLRKKNNEAKYSTWEDWFDKLSEQQLRDFGCRLENRLEALHTKLGFLKRNQVMQTKSGSDSSNAVVVAAPLSQDKSHFFAQQSLFDDQNYHGWFPFATNSMMSNQMMPMNGNFCPEISGTSGLLLKKNSMGNQMMQMNGNLYPENSGTSGLDLLNTNSMMGNQMMQMNGNFFPETIGTSELPFNINSMMGNQMLPMKGNFCPENIGTSGNSMNGVYDLFSETYGYYDDPMFGMVDPISLIDNPGLLDYPVQTGASSSQMHASQKGQYHDFQGKNY